MRTRKNTVGKRIKDLREEMGIAQKVLAKRIGIGNSHLSQIERDEKRPTAATLAAIAKELETTTDYLLLLTDEDERPQVQPELEAIGISVHAEEAARLIDGLASTAQRQFCVDMLRLFVGYRVSVGREWAGELGDIMHRFGPEAADLIADYLRDGKPLPDPARFGEVLAERKRFKPLTPVN